MIIWIKITSQTLITNFNNLHQFFFSPSQFCLPPLGYGFVLFFLHFFFFPFYFLLSGWNLSLLLFYLSAIFHKLNLGFFNISPFFFGRRWNLRSQFLFFLMLSYFMRNLVYFCKCLNFFFLKLILWLLTTHKRFISNLMNYSSLLNNFFL